MNKKMQQELEAKIEYHFNNYEILRNALTHSSFANEKHLGRLADNERLEFLGDAVLEIVVSEYLYNHYPEEPEGVLTRKRASMVCEPTLAMCAREIELGSYLQMGKGEEVTGGRQRDSITSDAMEALIGAIYLDGGFTNAKEFIHRRILNDIETKQLFYDSKTILQEIIQSLDHPVELTYRLVSEDGPDHNKQFVVEALLDGQVMGNGTGRTKKAAQQEAAYHVILHLRSQKIV